MDEALHALLLANTALTARVGQRIYWGEAKQGEALPAVVLNIVGGADQPHLTGTDGLWRYRVQADCYGLDRPTARLVSRDMISLLHGYTGGGFNAIFLDSQREDDDSAAPDRPTRFMLDFNIIWRG